MKDMQKNIEIKNIILEKLSCFSAEQLDEKTKQIENKLFDLANFIEAKIVLLYTQTSSEVNTINIIEKTLSKKKMVVIPSWNKDNSSIKLMRIENTDNSIIKNSNGITVPNPERCKEISINHIDIAVIPGFAFDEKGGKLTDEIGHYDKLMTKLPVTTRKISIAFEEQIVPQIQMDPNNKNVDIIITDKRIIYKI